MTESLTLRRLELARDTMFRASFLYNSSMLKMQALVHYSFHFIAPGFLAWIFFNEQWELAWMIMVGTMLVDIDHLLARPIFDPKRCSIGFHVLHSYPAIAVYGLLLFVPNFYVQAIAVGLLFHMYTDWQDCLWTSRSESGHGKKVYDTMEKEVENI